MCFGGGGSKTPAQPTPVPTQQQADPARYNSQREAVAIQAAQDQEVKQKADQAAGNVVRLGDAGSGSLMTG